MFFIVSFIGDLYFISYIPYKRIKTEKENQENGLFPRKTGV